MILLKESGRLGNQLFQYAALQTLRHEQEELVLLGFEILQEAFNGIDARIVNTQSSRWERLLYHRIYRIADSLSQRNVLTRIKESKNSPEILLNQGMISKFSFVEESYFQGETYFCPEAISDLSLKPEILTYARNVLNTIVQDKTPVFVHIRRGDYIRWPDKDYPAVLSAKYYWECIKIFQSTLPSVFFIFTSDDPFYVKDIFGDLEDSYISQGSSLEDFSLMTHCQGGVLSASSFSWWAAYFSNLKAQSRLFIAPKFWAGHYRKNWYPSFIKTNFINYV